MMIAEDETGDREPRLTSATGGTGETKPHPRPSYGGLQEIVMLTLIEDGSIPWLNTAMIRYMVVVLAR